MKTLAELKEMNFIPHHDCGCCGSTVGWYNNGDRVWFDPSCDCGCSEGHYDSWLEAFKWYNTVFEKESVSAVQDEWDREIMLDAAKKEEG